MHLLPVGLVRLAGLLILVESVYLVSWYTRFFGRLAITRHPKDPSIRKAAGFFGLFLVLWLVVAILVGDGEHFPLPNESLRLPIRGLVFLGFFLPALAWAYLSRTGRTLVSTADPADLIGVQWYRAAGFIFLFPMLAYHALPAEFALPAGIGDILTGLMAPVVAWAVANRKRGAYGWAIAWNLFGILDLIVAPATAVHSGAQILQMYPLSIVPLFLGPPMGTLTHLLTLRSLSVHKAEITGEVTANGPLLSAPSAAH